MQSRLIPTPSHSNRSFKSSSSMNEDNFLTAKEECHSKTESAIDEWGESLKNMIKFSEIHDMTQKNAKSFTQVDSLLKNTKSSLEKSSKMLDKLLEK
ncbi:hypothetical protein K501DRAFT_187937 [Backusella circina FSU 941]|nr:hypothetical protein K501DRAFT_187937 [Backusella circina FSU 941]